MPDQSGRSSSRSTPDPVSGCRHCGEPIEPGMFSAWVHVIGPGSVLYRCDPAKSGKPYGLVAEAPEPSGFHAQAGTRREGQHMTLTALPRSEQRRKNHQVKVRLDDDDLAGLDRMCKANGITGPELLRLGLHRFLNEEGVR